MLVTFKNKYPNLSQGLAVCVFGGGDVLNSVLPKDIGQEEPGIELPTLWLTDDPLMNGFKLPPLPTVPAVCVASSICIQWIWGKAGGFSLVTLAASMLEQPGVMKAWGISWWQELCVDSSAGRALQGWNINSF